MTHPLPRLALTAADRSRLLSEIHLVAADFRDRGGPVVEVTPVPWGPKLVFVSSPQGVQDVLSRNDNVFERETTFHKVSRLAGPNLFNMSYEQWLPRRKAMQPLFTRRASAEHVPTMSGQAARAAGEWLKQGTIDLHKSVRELNLRILGQTVYVLDLSDRADAIGNHVRIVLGYMMGQTTRAWNLPRWIPSGSRKQFDESLAYVLGVSQEAIELSRTDRARVARPNSGIVHALLELRNLETGLPFSDEQIGNELGAFLVAALDAETMVLSHTLWQLGHHPEIQERVAAETDQLPDGGWYMADVHRLVETANVVKESMRLCPPSAIITRVTSEPTTIDGYEVPKGRMPMISTWALHRDPALWERPLEFDADRFTPARSAGRHPYQYIPFSAGERNCIGEQYAMFSAIVTVAQIVKVARLTSVSSEFPVNYQMTMSPAEPSLCRVTRR